MLEGFEPEIDWAQIYEIFDGTMSKCLGRNCPNSCCRSRSIRLVDGGLSSYNTALYDESERTFLKARLRARGLTLKSLGITFRRIEARRNEGIIFPIVVEWLFRRKRM